MALVAVAGASVVTATTPSADTVSPGIAGFLVVFALALATVVLIRSMVGHLRKVRYSPDPAAGEPETPAGDPAGPADPVASSGPQGGEAAPPPAAR